MIEPASNAQQFFAGLDELGRSAIVGVGAPAQSRAGGAITVRNLFALSAGSGILTPGQAVAVPALDVGVGPGASRAFISSFDQGYDSGMHRTETVDLSVVIAGSVDFHVETAVVTMNVGDCMMVPGVLHRWYAMNSPCTLALVMIGAEPAGR